MKIARLLSIATATAVLALSASAASAATLAAGSELGIIGTFSPTGGTGLGDATGLSIDGGTVIIGSNDLAGQVGGSATYSALALDGSSLPLDPLFTTTGGLSFALTGISVDLQNGQALDWTGTGILSLAGFDDTQATISWTGDALGGLNTFSSTLTVIPVPGAVWLFVSGLAILGIRRRA